MLKLVWTRLLGPIIRWIIFENAAEAFSLKIGFTGVISVIALAFVDALRDLSLAWQAFFIAGIFFIFHFAVWMAWPWIDWARRASRQQALILRQWVGQFAGDQDYLLCSVEVISIQMSWQLSAVQNLLHLGFDVRNHSMLRITLGPEYSGAISYQNHALAAPGIEVQGVCGPGGWTRLLVKQPITPEALATMQEKQNASLVLKDFRVPIRGTVPGLDANPHGPLPLPEAITIPVPTPGRGGGGWPAPYAVEIKPRWP